MKRSVGTIIALVFFWLAIVFLAFPKSDIAHFFLRRIDSGIYLGRAVKPGLGCIAVGLGALAWAWRDWQGGD